MKIKTILFLLTLANNFVATAMLEDPTRCQMTAIVGILALIWVENGVEY